jgi:8-oxo-dGTP pyrophosphatase MutT (NUDIX family)
MIDVTPSPTRLIWDEQSAKTAADFRIFTVEESLCRSPRGDIKPFSVIATSDWVMTVPVLETGRGKEFVMVRQWRHGARALSVEFPGGVLEAGETSADGAAREFREETGYLAGSLTALGAMNPNPAIMANRIHFYLAQNLTPTGRLDLDENEFVETVTLPVDEVAATMGNPPFIHALTAAALLFYIRFSGSRP